MDAKTEGRIFGFGAVALALVAFGWPNLPPVIRALAQAGAIICAVLTIWFLLPAKFREWGDKRQMFALVSMIAFGTAAAICAVVYFWPRQPAAAPKLEAKILFECSVTFSAKAIDNVPNVLPIFTLFLHSKPGEHVTPYNFIQAGGGTASTTALGGDISQMVFTCEVTNYDTAPLFNVVVPFKLVFQRAIPAGQNGFRSGEVLSRVDLPVRIPRLDQGSDKLFRFLAWSPSDAFITVLFPREVSAHRLGSETPVSIGVIESSTNEIILDPPRPKPAPQPKPKHDLAKHSLKVPIPHEKPPPFDMNEAKATVKGLWNKWLDRDGLTSNELAGLVLPPDDWMNEHLTAIHRNYRVRAEGAQFKIFPAEGHDAPSNP